MSESLKSKTPKKTFIKKHYLLVDQKKCPSKEDPNKQNAHFNIISELLASRERKSADQLRKLIKQLS